jgi:hypothetical protein
MKIVKTRVQTIVDGRKWICEVGAYTRDNGLSDADRDQFQGELERLFEKWIKGKLAGAKK